MPKIAPRARPALLAATMAAALCWGTAPALAQEDGDPHDNTQAMTAGIARIVSRDLAVLQLKPDAASDACVSALRDLHKTQDQIAYEEKRTKYQDLPVARDVLDSNYEDVSQYCGTDAKRLCRSEQGATAQFSTPCAGLRKNEDDEESGR